MFYHRRHLRKLTTGNSCKDSFFAGCVIGIHARKNWPSVNTCRIVQFSCYEYLYFSEIFDSIDNMVV